MKSKHWFVLYYALLIVLFLSRVEVLYAQNVDFSQMRTGQVTSPNLALYTFLRAASSDEQSSPEDKARSAALIAEIGLGGNDTLILSSTFSSYSAAIRALHDPSNTSTESEIRRDEINAYVHVIQQLRTRLSQEGLNQLRAHLSRKMSKMHFHQRKDETSQ